MAKKSETDVENQPVSTQPLPASAERQSSSSSGILARLGTVRVSVVDWLRNMGKEKLTDTHPVIS